MGGQLSKKHIIKTETINNGVGKLPALGFNTWNLYQCNYTADVLLEQAQAIVDRGLLKARYNCFMLDDCYSLKERDENGRIFPNGMKNFTESLAKLGFRAGIYSDAGYHLETFAEWGFEYLKYDNSYIPFDNVTQENQPWRWAGRLGQSWRIGGDIRPWWSALSTIINQASFIAGVTGFYGRNDLDMLEVGNTGIGTPPGNLSYDEAKSHFTAWALLKSPLLIGSDVASASRETIEILGNEDILRINQDPHVREAVAPFRWGHNADYTWDPDHPAEYWTGNSSYSVVFMVLNTLDEPRHMSFNLTESWAIRAGRLYSVYDLWTHTDNGTAYRNISLALPPHNVAALLLNGAGPEPEAAEPYCAVWWQCSYPNVIVVDDDDGWHG
ncbi:glycoside hydrolase family 27 protein [Thermothelomyces heterothallicus CBS 202.75]|uniref:glycoside hydrolase family 27 protein n=1 Tax=Thermothelomyces heterothallicus CBS 202.75 TaxID=1149848 RepID=UPI003743709E